MPCSAVVTHNRHTVTKMPSAILSPGPTVPIRFNSAAAKAAASGVRRISGGLRRYTTSGTTASEHSPGTIPARNHFTSVIS